MENPLTSDQLTVLYRRAVDTLFLQNPVGTSLGIFLGLILDGASAAFAAGFQGWAARSLETIKWWVWIALGIFCFNIRPYLRRHKLHPTLVEALEFIKQQERDKAFSQWQIRQMYQNLFEKVLERLVLEPELEERLRLSSASSNSSVSSSSTPPSANA